MKALGKAVRNYNGLLIVIATCTSLLVPFLVWIVFGDLIAELNLSTRIKVVGVAQIDTLYVLFAIGAFFLSRMVKLHDKVSDLIGLRLRFDVAHILTPLLRNCDVKFTKQRLRIHRHQLMRRCFYRYAGSSNPKIDVHEIEQALEAWAVVWVFLEFGIYFLNFGLAAAITDQWSKCVVLAAFSVLCFLLIILFLKTCRERATSEVEAILLFNGAKDEIKSQCDEVLR